MAKGKARWFPDKPQNKMGKFCSYYEEYKGGFAACEGLIGSVKVCKGNPHNCVKTLYHKLAIHK
jgi:hypothetical protein